MEASALHAPAGFGRLKLTPAFLRLRSDEQLVALFRAGSEDSFAVIHDRYRQRLFAYVRQMLGPGSRQDAEDVLQDVFVRAYGALRADERDVLLRAWLYRVAHNRCIDVLRRPVPPAAEVFEMSRKPLFDPFEEAQRRDDLARLVRDVSQLPEQQRSALLMREIDGVTYAEIADVLGVTVPAVKSLLVRARMGLVEAQSARDEDCTVIRDDLLRTYDKGVKASGHARRHMRECSGCRDYRTELRGMRRSFAALAPAAGFAPIALAAKALGLGGAGGGAAASAGGSAAGGAAALAGGATACKVAAVVCTAAITAGGAVEVSKVVRHSQPAPTSAARSAPPAAPGVETAAGRRAALTSAAATAPAPITERVLPAAERTAAEPTSAATEPALDTRALPTDDASAPVTDTSEATGGTVAPVEPPTRPDGTAAPARDGTAAEPAGAGSGSSTGAGASAAPSEQGSEGSGTAGSSDPSGQH